MTDTTPAGMGAWIRPVEHSLASRPAGADLADIAFDTGLGPGRIHQTLGHLVRAGRVEELHGAEPSGRTVFRLRLARPADTLRAVVSVLAGRGPDALASLAARSGVSEQAIAGFLGDRAGEYTTADLDALAAATGFTSPDVAPPDGSVAWQEP